MLYAYFHRPASVATRTPNTLGYSLIGTLITGGQQQLMDLMSTAQMKSWRHSLRKHLFYRDTCHQSLIQPSLMLE